ncbi:uncharacterized protein LTR77_002306 [Saxophila tyrrhenica]|uniref:Uncharacterized protein n=1 Tax=Saxophila tyrrhenica TaxID=1690608 RepID=A0AAV9PLN8_9PEZI|nr:hypothetical protein LTR77_002306 [Saxophila tyrrhenica]
MASSEAKITIPTILRELAIFCSCITIACYLDNHIISLCEDDRYILGVFVPWAINLTILLSWNKFRLEKLESSCKPADQPRNLQEGLEKGVVDNAEDEKEKVREDAEDAGTAGVGGWRSKMPSFTRIVHMNALAINLVQSVVTWRRWTDRMA